MRATWRAFPADSATTAGAMLQIHAGDGIVAACTTRQGGSSSGAYASLNLSQRAEDDPGAVTANRGRVLAALNVPDARWTQGEQVHGAGVDVVDSPSDVVAGVDALITDQPGIALAVLVADCVPIVLVDRAALRIGVVHAGWRGLAAGVVEAAIARMHAPGLAAYIGPSIGPCCFEVGDEVSEVMVSAFDGSVRRDAQPRPHVDLWRASVLALRRGGVGEIGLAASCTRCDPHRFFSHRAGAAGRQALVAAIADPRAIPDPRNRTRA